MARDNMQLREEMSGLKATLFCKQEEYENLNKKYKNMQIQQTLFLANNLQSNGINVQTLLA